MGFQTIRLAPTGGWRIDLLELAVVEMPPGYVAPEGELDPPVLEAINVLLLRRPGTVLLVDTGPGLISHWMPGLSAAALGATLESLECSLDAIDIVLLTHLHFDHVGGLVQGEWPDSMQLTTPHAQVLLLAEAAEAARTEQRELPMNAATTVIELLDATGQLTEVHDRDEVAPAVILRSTPGHAPGHGTVEIGGQDPLVFTGDLLHHPIHAQRPEWAGVPDADRQRALETRLQMLAELSDRGVRVVAPHLREPSVGRFARAGTAFAWIASQPIETAS
jgi:glyoxylase-like metal-dependent hydrolase (beta-lactamase superfamily II)